MTENNEPKQELFGMSDALLKIINAFTSSDYKAEKDPFKHVLLATKAAEYFLGIVYIHLAEGKRADNVIKDIIMRTKDGVLMLKKGSKHTDS